MYVYIEINKLKKKVKVFFLVEFKKIKKKSKKIKK